MRTREALFCHDSKVVISFLGESVAELARDNQGESFPFLKGIRPNGVDQRKWFCYGRLRLENCGNGEIFWEVMKKSLELTVFTIGHSTHPIGEFVEMLKAHEVETVADIRTVPRSRHNPQFDCAALPGLLADAGLEYVYIKQLGGLRKTNKESINGGWRNTSFRGYADHMQTDEFHEGLETLIGLAGRRRVAIMCAEAVPWRCHRSLVGDALLVRGIAVDDIMSTTSRKPHKLTSFAKVNGVEITYPPYEGSGE